MTTHHAIPPIRVHSERRISLEEAANYISEYLASAEENAALHPNAILTESGPQTTTSTAANTGLVFHNMQRVAAGLRGERLGPEKIEFGITNEDTSFRQSAMEQDPGNSKSKKQRQQDDAAIEDKATEAEASLTGLAPTKEQSAKLDDDADDGTNTADWQDKSEFEREQDIVQGDVGPRDAAAGMRDGAQVPKVKRADKVDRKAAKKAKRGKEKREREEAMALAKSVKNAAETAEEVVAEVGGTNDKDSKRRKEERKKRKQKRDEEVGGANNEDSKKSKEEKKKRKRKRDEEVG